MAKALELSDTCRSPSITHNASRTLENSTAGPPAEENRWDEAISQAARHVQTGGTDDGSASGPTRLRGPLLGFLGVVVTVSIAVVTVQLSEPPPARLSPTDQASDLRAEAALLVEQIEAYLAEQGTLPDPVALVPYLEEGYEYQVIDRSRGLYLVRREAAGVTVTYDGSLPLNLWVLLGGGTTGGEQ